MTVIVTELFYMNNTLSKWHFRNNVILVNLSFIHITKYVTSLQTLDYGGIKPLLIVSRHLISCLCPDRICTHFMSSPAFIYI